MEVIVRVCLMLKLIVHVTIRVVMIMSMVCNRNCCNSYNYEKVNKNGLSHKFDVQVFTGANARLALAVFLF